MKIVKIDSENIYLLVDFINTGDESFKTFRYFNSRDVSVIKNHLVTLMLTDNKCRIPMAYGHLDNCDSKIWLGICVHSNYKNKGYGKIIMQELIKLAAEMNLKAISLTVDKENTYAIKLYESYNFKKLMNSKKSYFFYELKIKNES